MPGEAFDTGVYLSVTLPIEDSDGARTPPVPPLYRTWLGLPNLGGTIVTYPYI